MPLLRGGDAWSVPNVIFLVAGALGVPLGGVVMTWRTGGRAGLADLGRRLVDAARPGRWGWALVLLLFPLATVAGAGLDVWLRGTARPLDLAGLQELVRHPAAFAGGVLFVLLAGPVPEEIGWRGFAQDRLQRAWSPLAAALVVGLLWASWHAPLYGLEGYYEAFGAARPHPLEHVAGILVSSVLYAWAYNRTGGSVLAVVLLHFMENVTGDLLGPTATGDLYELFVLAGVALIVLALEGPSLGAGREARSAGAAR